MHVLADVPPEQGYKTLHLNCHVHAFVSLLCFKKMQSTFKRCESFNLQQLISDSCTISHQKLLLLVSGGVTGHSVEVHQISQHAITQHRQVGGDGCQSVAHENAGGVTG